MGLTIWDEELCRNINEGEILEVISKAKKFTAGGVNGIATICWKELVKNRGVLNSMVKLFNKIFGGDSYPREWKRGIICPIFKGKGSRLDPNNYRGITLLDSLSKIYGGVLANRLRNWAEKHDILSIYQNGFRRGRRTTDNIMIVKTVIDKYVTIRGGKLFMATIDLEKAFDTV